MRERKKKETITMNFQFVGVWLTVRYRNQKDPRANPSAFL